MSKPISTLIIKQLSGEITPDERTEIQNYAAESEENRQMVENYTNKKRLLEEVKLRDEWRNEDEWRKIEKGLPGKQVRFNYYQLAAAAVLLAIGIWFYLKKGSNNKIPYTQEEYHPTPYRQAKLTLGNGKVLNLHELKNGSLGEDGMVTKNDSQVIYPLNYTPRQFAMNILETPKGNYFIIRLPDSSIARLNSGSSIQYPNRFTGNKRVVTVQGEVYFEVAKDPSRPFIVKEVSDGSETEVLGTRFIVNAYKGDNTVRITLLEGKVKVKGEKYVDFLKPGEQLIAKDGKKLQKLEVVSAEARVQGWKENKFKWVNADLRTMLEDISHWHGNSIKYKVNVPLDTYNVVLDRSEPLNNVFKVLHKATLLDFKLEGTTIVVYRNVNRGK